MELKSFKEVFASNELVVPTAEGVLPTPYLGIDVGSTETRSMLFMQDLVIGEVMALDSQYAIVPSEVRTHVQGKSLKDNLEFILTDNDAGTKIEPVLKAPTRIAKGKLLRSMAAYTINTTASSSKIDQDATYINILSNIAINLFLFMDSAGTRPTGPVVTDISISLPPEDTISEVRVQSFKNKLCGSYTVDFTRMGFSFTFVIEQGRLMVMSEPAAVATYLQVNGRMNDEGAYVIIDIGGRSTGYAVVLDGVLLENNARSEPYGGNQLVDIIAREATEELGIQPPTHEMIYKALQTGMLNIGVKQISIADSIDKAKTQLANPIFNGLSVALDTNNIQAQQVVKVFGSGRTFGKSGTEEAVASRSLLPILEDIMKNRAPYTGFEMVGGDYPLVQGLVFARFSRGV